MGTNYYWHPPSGPRCPTCGRSEQPEEIIHIGKSSAGWTFSFHATDEIRSAQQWQEVTKHGKIVDEYGRVEPHADFWDFVERKKSEKLNHAVQYPTSSYRDVEGNSFSEGEFS